MNEGNWKEIHGCCGYYISDQGQCFSIRSNRLLKPTHSLYIKYNLIPNGCNKCRPFSASRLVLSHFGKTSKLRPYCDHIDNDCKNNCISNLRAVTRTINQLNRTSKGYRKWGRNYSTNRHYKSDEGVLVSDRQLFPDQQSAVIAAEELKQKFIRKCFAALEERERREGVPFQIDPRWYLLFTTKKVKGRGCRSRFS